MQQFDPATRYGPDPNTWPLSVSRPDDWMQQFGPAYWDQVSQAAGVETGAEYGYEPPPPMVENLTQDFGLNSEGLSFVDPNSALPDWNAPTSFGLNPDGLSFMQPIMPSSESTNWPAFGINAGVSGLATAFPALQLISIPNSVSNAFGGPSIGSLFAPPPTSQLIPQPTSMPSISLGVPPEQMMPWDDPYNNDPVGDILNSDDPYQNYMDWIDDQPAYDYQPDDYGGSYDDYY